MDRSTNNSEPTSLRDLVRSYLHQLPLPEFHPAVEHRASGIAGRGIHATRPISAGTILVTERGPIVDQRTIDAVHAFGYECELRIGWGLYSLYRPVHDDNEGGYINHSCVPNAGLIDIRTWAAIRDISAGEEITCDYGSFETESGWTLLCSCGASTCRGTITGRDYRLPDLKLRLGQYFAPYLRDPSLTKKLRTEHLPLLPELDALNDADQRAHDAAVEAMMGRWEQVASGAR
jgi:hypothetical protein